MISPTPNMIAEKVGPVGKLIFNKPAEAQCHVVRHVGGDPGHHRRVQNDPAIRVVVVTGAGERLSSRAPTSRSSRRPARPRAGSLLRQDRRDRECAPSKCSKPTIARIRGYCVGGGMAVSLICDIRMASDNCKFGVPAARLGLGYRASGIKTLTDLVGPSYAKEISSPPAVHRPGGSGHGADQPGRARRGTRRLRRGLLQEDRRECAAHHACRQAHHRGADAPRRQAGLRPHTAW